jgi:hypothetical protein
LHEAKEKKKGKNNKLLTRKELFRTQTVVPYSGTPRKVSITKEPYKKICLKIFLFLRKNGPNVYGKEFMMIPSP